MTVHVIHSRGGKIGAGTETSAADSRVGRGSRAFEANYPNRPQYGRGLHRQLVGCGRADPAPFGHFRCRPVSPSHYLPGDGLLSRHAHRIAHFRMFAMRDNWERNDQVWEDGTVLSSGRDWRSLVHQAYYYTWCPAALRTLAPGLHSPVPYHSPFQQALRRRILDCIDDHCDDDPVPAMAAAYQLPSVLAERDCTALMTHARQMMDKAAQAELRIPAAGRNALDRH